MNHIWIKKVQGATRFSFARCKYRIVYIINQIKRGKKKKYRQILACFGQNRLACRIFAVAARGA